MPKALDQMNVLLPHVISDITGLTGMAIIDAFSPASATRRRWRNYVTNVFALQKK
jgi:hypothetical protein